MNKFRGEADIHVGGKKYPVVLSLGSLADMATKLNLKTFAELQDRMFHLTDLPAIVEALLASNGHNVPITEIRNMDLYQYMNEVLPAIFRRKDEAEESPNPRKAPAS